MRGPIKALLNAKLLPLAVAICSSTASADFFGVSEDDVANYQAKSELIQFGEIVNEPDLCAVLPKEACALISSTPGVSVQNPTLSSEDVLMLRKVLKLTPDQASDGTKSVMPDSRKTIIKNSGLTLGTQLGVAVESARYNWLWKNYARLYDRAVNFTPLLIDLHGRNIVPPVIISMGDSRRVGAGGKVFRIAEQTYRVVEPPRFTIEPPNWRTYLNLEITRPGIPPSSVLPDTAEETDLWRTYLVTGYVKGIETTRKRVEAKYRRLERDYTGMVLYHLMRSFNMISEPKVSVAHTPVVTTSNGSSMAIDDTILVLSVDPTMNAIRENWKIYPLLKKFTDIRRNRDMDLLFGVGAEYE